MDAGWRLRVSSISQYDSEIANSRLALLVSTALLPTCYMTPYGPYRHIEHPLQSHFWHAVRRCS